MSDSSTVLDGVVRSGDTVLIGQAASEPPTLVAALLRLAAEVEDVTAICGYALDPVWLTARPGRPYLRSYSAQGPLRALARAGLVDLMPLHYSRIEDHVRDGRLAADVVLLQVGPPDEEGYYALGATVDYVVVAAEAARAVVVEVNPNMPRTQATRRLHRSLVTAEVATSAPLAVSPVRAPSPEELAVASNVAALVPDGATIQVGLGALAEAIAAELHGRRNLRVRAGLVGDWLVGLYEAGAMAPGPATCVTGIALGTDRLYRFLDGNDRVRMAPLSEQLAVDALAAAGPFITMNSAIEVDLLGQVNAEVGGGRYVGAVGGQVDFFRGAHVGDGGLAVVALAAGPGSASRIVAHLSGPVTTPKSDVDVVVTEWGVADLRGADFGERACRLAAIAHPDVRDELLAALPPWVRTHDPRPAATAASGPVI
jgi:acyl-CoA hydrolase